jgi:hypothetical protein
MRKHQRRPQPAGWDKAMKRVLRPEHVERLNDKQVRITLPPCPDFDIEEDEEIEVWIPAAAVVNATRPIFAGKFMIKADSFEERIDNAIQGLREERTDIGSRSVIADFLLTFFTCEIVAKAIVSHARHGRTGRKALADKWSTKDISQALTALGIQFDQVLLDGLFSTVPALASEMSARALRDSIAHRMKRVHRQAIRDRYAPLIEAMESFLRAIDAWREPHRIRTAEAPRPAEPRLGGRQDG